MTALRAKARLIEKRRATLNDSGPIGDLARGVMAFVGDDLLGEAADLLTAAYDAGMHGGIEGLRMELLVHHVRAGRSLDRVPLGHPADRATPADVYAALAALEDVAVELVDALGRRQLALLRMPALADGVLSGFCCAQGRHVQIALLQVVGVVAVRRSSVRGCRRRITR